MGNIRNQVEKGGKEVEKVVKGDKGRGWREESKRGKWV